VNDAGALHTHISAFAGLIVITGRRDGERAEPGKHLITPVTAVPLFTKVYYAEVVFCIHNCKKHQQKN